MRRGVLMAAFKRSGLHRLECCCGSYVYATVAQLERVGLPCCACGEPFEPERFELGLLLGVDCQAVRDYHERIYRFELGQKGSKKKGSEHLASPEQEVASEFSAAYRSTARARRLAAIGSREVKVKRTRKVAVLRVQSDPMPF
jgi:hypothetical protein